MRFHPAALGAFLFLASAARSAEYVPLGGAMVAYDPAVWKVVELSGIAGLIFTCIAVDCRGRPQVHAVSTAAVDGAAGDFFRDEIWRDAEPLVDPAPPDGALEWTAASRWSGCRAHDNPILSAHALQGGAAYHFSTGVGAGCNFGPHLPQGRFLELLRGVIAIGPE